MQNSEKKKSELGVINNYEENVIIMSYQCKILRKKIRIMGYKCRIMRKNSEL